MKKEMKLFTITSFLICSFIGLTSAQSNNEVLAYKDLLAEKKKEVHYKAAEENKNEIETVFSGLFKVYKNFISSQDGSNCVFYPSCSEYGLLAVKKYGVLLGTANTMDRLTRCNGLSPEKYAWTEDRTLMIDELK
ncbi:membrane protein insertion efficiency factor YidD [Cyclobacterium sp. 1_MG-2023]|uniref:membrane protein insertion efficiency factor YidD n=1 Tax=Cyclobacterium sp. 1_MG-2023 TaxID=3062681 RepID=UPI0026E1A3C6|nr:membrane protein insertion efficiency factor YidD [Cyclobacterium sp. 1_MG-2023]MDO6438840.1 membrane protein insertion efficiency factor YidD [Cyclobacterium sp. 1_MG-2023]